MNRIRVTKEFQFETAHALSGYDGPCKNIHGHSYTLSVTVSGIPVTDPASAKLGMVLDFGDLKKIVRQEIIDYFDHALVLNATASGIEHLTKNEPFTNVILLPYQPTSENMLIDFAQRLKRLLPEGIQLYSLRLRETTSSFAEWFAEDNL
jgi:6-pyruvoyltetrahydropterin/6-carboxytetrahydropterin synthase